MGHATAVVAATLLLLIPSTTVAQPAGAGGGKLSFEVAAVRRNVSGDQNASTQLQPGGRVTITNNTLFNMIRNAYNVQSFQVLGGPDWVRSDRWNVVAKAEGDVRPQDLLLMLQDLVNDRFKAVIRRETREMAVYALVLARRDERLGPQLMPASVDCAAIMADAARGSRRPPPQPSGRPTCGTRMTNSQMQAGGITTDDLARNLAGATDRIVINRTGLSGTYDLELKWTPDRLPSRAPGDQPGRINGADIEPDGPSLFTALQEQLGLKLESTRGPVDVLVIERAEHPTED